MRRVFALALFAVGCSPRPPCITDAGVRPEVCPEVWSIARDVCAGNHTCPDPGLTCEYPGAGDTVQFTGEAACATTRSMYCVSGRDGGPARWSCPTLP